MGILKFIKQLFSKKPENKEPLIEQFSNEEYDKQYELKKNGLEAILGEMYRLVGHAIIPFQVGGAVDMYYFTKHIEGTGFATMELIEPDGSGPKPNADGTYELVAFTKHEYDSNDDEHTEFNEIERRVCGIFTKIGFYSFDATLKPGDTCELPYNNEKSKFIVFDKYKPGNVEFFIGENKHHLLLCVEIFESEMNFARENGSSELFNKLKEKGYYPYSDMDREPVV